METIWCPHCRLMIKPEEKSATFRGEPLHASCLIKVGLKRIGNIFYFDSDIISALRRVKDNWESFGEAALLAYKKARGPADLSGECRMPDAGRSGASIEPDGLAYLFDLLAQCFPDKMKQFFQSEESSDVIPLIPKAATREQH